MFVSVYNHVFIVLYILLIVKYQFLLLLLWHHPETGGGLISWNSWWENEYSVYLLLYIFLLYYNVTLELLYWKSEKKKKFWEKKCYGKYKKAAGLWFQGCALTLNYILMCFAAFGNESWRKKAGHFLEIFFCLFQPCTFFIYFIRS